MLRLTALLEAVTLLLLLGLAMPLKYLAGIEQATSLAGSVHGLAFLAFSWTVLRSLSAGEIDRGDAGRLMLGAFIPFGGIVNERWLAGRGRAG